MVLSIGVFFSLLVAGLARSLPATLGAGLTAPGVPAGAAPAVAALPPVGSAVRRVPRLQPDRRQLLGPGVLGDAARRTNAAALTGQAFFPHLISGPFHAGWSWCSPRRS